MLLFLFGVITDCGLLLNLTVSSYHGIGENKSCRLLQRIAQLRRRCGDCVLKFYVYVIFNQYSIRSHTDKNVWILNLFSWCLYQKPGEDKDVIDEVHQTHNAIQWVRSYSYCNFARVHCYIYVCVKQLKWYGWSWYGFD